MWENEQRTEKRSDFHEYAEKTKKSKIKEDEGAHWIKGTRKKTKLKELAVIRGSCMYTFPWERKTRSTEIRNFRRLPPGGAMRLSYSTATTDGDWGGET